MPSPTITFRKMHESEYAVWRKADEASYAQEKANALAISIQQARKLSQQAYQRLLPKGRETPNHYFFTLRNQQSTHIGDVWYSVSTEWGVTSLFICSIEIHARFHRQGYGHAAMQVLETRAKKLGASRVALHVIAANKGAIALYEKAGYQTTDLSMAKNLVP